MWLGRGGAATCIYLRDGTAKFTTTHDRGDVAYVLHAYTLLERLIPCLPVAAARTGTPSRRSREANNRRRRRRERDNIFPLANLGSRPRTSGVLRRAYVVSCAPNFPFSTACWDHPPPHPKAVRCSQLLLCFLLVLRRYFIYDQHLGNCYG